MSITSEQLDYNNMCQPKLLCIHCIKIVTVIIRNSTNIDKLFQYILG